MTTKVHTESERNSNEFYCTKSGGGCGGFFTVNVNVQINGVFEIICPKCDHHHRRRIKDGEITDDSRWSSKPVEELIGLLPTYRTTARSILSTKRVGTHEERCSVVLKDKDRSFINDRWFEIHGGKL